MMHLGGILLYDGFLLPRLGPRTEKQAPPLPAAGSYLEAIVIEGTYGNDAKKWPVA